MAQIKVEYDKLPYQQEFHEATEFFDILSAGMGGGKTYSLCMKGLRLMTINRGFRGGILCPDLKMFKRDVLPTFEDICFKNRIPIKFRRADSELVFETTKSRIMVFHAEDDGRSIRGPNLAFGLVNEVTLCSKPAFDAFVARIRVKEAPLAQVAMSGTPEGFNWFYRDFIEKSRHNARVVYGDMRQNPYVSSEYVKRLEEQFDPASREAYVEGKFVNMKGKAVAYSFSRTKHGTKGTQLNRDFPIWFAVDFNVDPMAASIWQPIKGNNGKTTLLGIGEIRLRDASTETLARVMDQWLIDNSPHDWPTERTRAFCSVFPDPAGNARNTRSDFSDLEILRNAGFKDLRYKKSIRSVRDCINALNAKLNRGEIILDLEKMPETVADLEQCVWKDGTFEIDKRDQGRTHWLDGLKNMVEFEFPIGEGRGGWREVKIR